MTTVEFLKHFPDFCVQTFDDNQAEGAVKDLSLTTAGKPTAYTAAKITSLNRKGAGIYFTPNAFPTGERKALLCTRVNAWIVECDDLSIADQWKNLKASPLAPSFVVQTKSSLHAYWLAKDGSINNYQAVIRGLIKYFHGDEACKDISRVFRIPGYYHMKDRDKPVEIKLVEDNAKYYSEEEMMAAFPFKEERKVDYIKIPGVNDFWDVIGSLDNKSVLEKLSGQPIVKGEVFTFRPRRPEGEYIDVNGQAADSWIDGAGKIGSGKRGGPTWIQWLVYYGHSKAAIAEWAKINLPEAKNFDGSKTLRMPTVKKDYKLRYTWGTRKMDTSFAIIKRSNFIVLAAKRSSGKTTLAFDLACKNAKLGHRVLFLSLEMDEHDIKDDIGRKYSGWTIEEEYDDKVPEHKQIAYANKIREIESIPTLYLRGIRRGGGSSWEDILENISLFDELDLIIIDNLDMIDAKDREDDWARQRRVVKEVMGFTSSRQIPVMMIHHYRKTNGKDRGMDEMSGSGKIADGADRILKVTRNTDITAGYPDKYRSTVYLQKGRGYPEASREIYFIRGTFVDTAPSKEEYGMTSSDLKQQLIDDYNKMKAKDEPKQQKLYWEKD